MKNGGLNSGASDDVSDGVCEAGLSPELRFRRPRGGIAAWMRTGRNETRYVRRVISDRARSFGALSRCDQRIWPICRVDSSDFERNTL